MHVVRERGHCGQLNSDEPPLSLQIQINILFLELICDQTCLFKFKMSQDYFQTLGITRSADKNEINRAYRKLALKVNSTSLQQYNNAILGRGKALIHPMNSFIL